MIDGEKIQINGVEYIVPALTFKQVKALSEDISQIGSVKDANLGADKIEKMLNIIHAAFSRNYPDMTREQVEDMLDLKNVRDVFHAVLGVSGFVEKKREV